MEKLVRSYKALCTEIGSRAQLVAISKGRSIEEIEILYAAGCRDFGENRVQELLLKWQLLPKDIRWHFVGPLQKNKVSKLIGKCHCIHSVDSLPLAEKIGKCSEEQKFVTSVLLQVNVSGEESKQGFFPGELAENVERLSRIQGIRIDGFMTMAPFTEDCEKIRFCFRALRKWRDHFCAKPVPRQRLHDSVPAHLSMGMSHDYRIALEEGASLIRIGSMLFDG